MNLYGNKKFRDEHASDYVTRHDNLVSTSGTDNDISERVSDKAKNDITTICGTYCTALYGEYREISKDPIDSIDVDEE